MNLNLIKSQGDNLFAYYTKLFDKHDHKTLITEYE